MTSLQCTYIYPPVRYYDIIEMCTYIYHPVRYYDIIEMCTYIYPGGVGQAPSARDKINIP